MQEWGRIMCLVCSVMCHVWCVLCRCSLHCAVYSLQDAAADADADCSACANADDDVGNVECVLLLYCAADYCMSWFLPQSLCTLLHSSLLGFGLIFTYHGVCRVLCTVS